MGKEPSRRLSVFLLLLLAPAVMGWAQEPGSATGQAGADRFVLAEDWSTLSLAGSHLQPETPVLGEKDDFAQFTRELIQLKWRQADPIDLYVIRPKGVAKPPVVLYLYGYPSETDRFRDNDYCIRLAANGFAAVGFVSALTGHRYHSRPMKEWFVSELQEALVTSVHDVQMILDFLSARDDLDLTKVGMFGEGSGGAIAVLAAATDPRIRAIDLLDPWGDWPDWMRESTVIPEQERANYLKPEFLQKVAGLDPVQWLPELKERRIRIQQVMDDTVTPKVARERIDSATPASATVLRYDDNMRFFDAASGGRIFEWVKNQLRPVSPSQPAAAIVQKSQSNPRAIEPGNDN
jgi:pimeloyl-ACP methyl ester carboxylesterase